MRTWREKNCKLFTTGSLLLASQPATSFRKRNYYNFNCAAGCSVVVVTAAAAAVAAAVVAAAAVCNLNATNLFAI